MTTTRRRIAHLLAAFCVAAIPFVVIAPAQAESVGTFGWWYQLNSGNLPVAPPPPPNAPSSGIYVQNVTGVGHNAYGAVTFSSPGSTAGTVTFTVENVTGAPEVALCPTNGPWQSDQAGSWTDRPKFTCDGAKGKVIGVFNDDQSQLTFQVTDVVSDGNGGYDLAVVADPVVDSSFELSLTFPGGKFFTSTSKTQPTVPPVGEPSPQATFSPPPADSGDSFGQPAPDAGSSTDLGGFVEEPETTEPAPADETAEAAPSEFEATPDELAGEPVAAKGPETTGQRIAAGIGLALLAIALWVVGTRSGEHLDPALARAGAITAAGGVGRFARVRTSEPIRLT